MPHASSRKFGGLPYVMGGLAYFPLIGIAFGAMAIAWGFANRKKGGRVLALIGAAGAAFNGICIAAVFYFAAVQSEETGAQLTKRRITSLTYAIEFHKAQTGYYPADLYTLKQAMPQDQDSILLDPMGEKTSDRARSFNYTLVGPDHYLLRSAGADGKLYTRDDISPDVELAVGSKVGLIIEPRARWTAGR